MDEYETPDTTEEYDQLHSVEGAYNLPKGEHRGQRHSYDYNPQYYIQAMEAQARQHQNSARGMQQTLHGVDVGKAIVNYYVGAKHYTEPHAEKIAGSVAGKIHREHLEPTENEMAFMTAKQIRARRPRRVLVKV